MVSRRLLASLLVSGLVLLASIGALATGPQGTIKHVIVVVQENRTPDSLFYADHPVLGTKNVRPPNNQGLCTKGGYSNVPVTLLPFSLDNDCFDPRHLHQSWVDMYDSGNMDGACKIVLHYYGSCTQDNVPQCPAPPNGPGGPCPQYTYADDSNHILDPYFQIANTYGFANYMFQTHQGPSFPAHQFLFAGTSAPVTYPDDMWNWFAAATPCAPVTNQSITMAVSLQPMKKSH